MKEKAIICDLDGTLAILERDPYDVSRCDEDRLNETIAKIIELYPAKVILVSGRNESGRTKTEGWLKRHKIFYEKLFMRAEKDNRKDAIIKRETYDDHIREFYDIDFVIEDRPIVVRMWRHDLNFLVLQLDDREF